MGLINGNMMLGSTILRRSSKRVSITYELKDCVSSNTVDTVAINSPYQTTIKSNTQLAYCGVQVLMGNKDISADVYDIYSGTINIDGVKSDIIIRAETLTTFEEASWYAVKCVAQSNIMNNEEALYNLSWRLGDTRPLIIGDYTYTVRICDLTPNRYQYVDDTTKYSNMVLECIELAPDSKPKHNTDMGDYEYCSIRDYYKWLETYAEQELQNNLSLVKLPTFWFNQQHGFSSNKLFMPGGAALDGLEYEQETIYQLYANDKSVLRKHKISDGTIITWCTRSGGYYSYNNRHMSVWVDTNGVLTAYNSTNTVNTATGVPIFWAW